MPLEDSNDGHSRRAFLGMFAGGSAGLAFGAHQLVDAVQRQSKLVDLAAIELEMSGVPWNTKGVARSLDMNEDGNKDVEVKRTDLGGGRDSVLQITSDGTETVDYAASVANVRPRDLTLGDLTDNETTYQYLAGEKNTGTVPDEVWLVVKPDSSGGKGKGKGGNGKGKGDTGKGTDDRRRYFLRTEVASSADSWQTRDVGGEIVGNSSLDPGSGQQWKEFLRDEKELTRVGDDLTEEVGDDATVQGIGVGCGTTTTGESTINVYFDEFVVAGEDTELPD